MFKLAERYIQLRKRCMSPSIAENVVLFNEMVLGLVITLFLLFMGSTDYFMFISTFMHAYTAWNEWEEYHSLKSQFQDAYLRMNIHGGPQIRTNDPEYFPYVIADAIVRLNERQQHSSGHHQPGQGKPKQEQSRPSRQT